MEVAAASFSNVYYDNYQLMSTMKVNNMPLPDSYLASIGFTLRRRLLELLAEDTVDRARLERIVADHLHWNHLWTDTAELERAAETQVLRLVRGAFGNPRLWSDVLLLITSLRKLHLTPNFYRAQNSFFRRWTPGYTFGLDEHYLNQALAVAVELEFELATLRQHHELVVE